MKQWEYLFIEFDDKTGGKFEVSFINGSYSLRNEYHQGKIQRSDLSLYEYLRKMGRQGWEVVGMTGNNILAKRALPKRKS